MSTEQNNDIQPREGEQHTVTFRTQRLFTVGNHWYFSTREGSDQGPFMSRELAEQAIESYVLDVQLYNWQIDSEFARQFCQAI